MSVAVEGFKKTISVAYILTLVGQVCELLFYLILFKFLLVEQVGLFNWIMAIAVFFAFFLDLGLTQTLIREFSQSRLNLKSVLLGSVVIRLPVVLLATIVFGGWYVYFNPPQEQYLALLLVGIIQILIMGEQFCQSWLKANAQQNIANMLTALGSMGRLGVALVLIYWLGILSVTHLFASLLFIHVVIFLVAILITYSIYHRTHFINPPLPLSVGATIRKLWVSSLVFGLIGFLTVIQNRLDWLMVSGFVSKIELANYSLANKTYEVLLMFVGIALATAYPWMCKDNPAQDFKIKLEIFLGFIVFSGITASLMAALYLPKILQLLWGDKYQLANPMIQLLMFGAALATISGACYYLLISKRLEKKILTVTAIATGLQVSTNFLLIPALGGLGAAIGMLVLIGTTGIGLSWLAHREQVLTSIKLVRMAVFLFIMLLLAGLLLYLDASMVLGLFALLALGIVGMYFILIVGTERKLLMNLVGDYFFKKGVR